MHCFATKSSPVPSQNISNQSAGVSSFTFPSTVAGTAYSLNSAIIFSEHVWILDTGATNHMCCYITHMHDVHPIDSPFNVHFPNGEQAVVTHIG